MVPTVLKLQAMSVSKSNNTWTITDMGPAVKLDGTVNDIQNPVQMFSIAAGGFAGVSADKPISGLAVYEWVGQYLGLDSALKWYTYSVSSSGLQLQHQASNTTSATIDYRVRIPLIAYDKQGKSRYLGAPAHITILGAPTTNFILQEPPKLAYWDENRSKIENVTGFDGNHVTFSHGTQSSVETTTKSETSRDTGGSVAISAGYSVNNAPSRSRSCPTMSSL